MFLRSLKTRFRFRLLLIAIFVLAAVSGALPVTALLQTQAANAGPGNAGFNYGEALQKALVFYEAQRSGSLSTSSIPTRLPWRGDSQLLDGKDNNVDLTGGWVDAGDNVKFAFPMTEAVALLAWGGIEYRSAYQSAGQLTWLANQLHWANDWFIKAHPSANVFYGQVGLGSSDHAYWAPQEVTSLTGLGSPTATGQPTNRPSYSINPGCGGGADLAGGAAAAMAASSIFFRSTDPTYADTLLTHATQLDAFAHAYQQVYTTCIADAANYYQSYSGYKDELVWSDIWLAKANDAKSTGSGSSYWTTARTEYNNLSDEPQSTTHSYKWTLAWDDKSYGDYALMALQFPNDAAGYNADVERWLDYWAPGGGITYTPGGHAHLDQWGSFRYAANTAFIAFVYADHITDATKQAKYRNFAEQQINYILGQNPRGCSYEMGFGACPPQRPHHRTAEGSWVNNMATPTVHRHILWGALSGSVDGSDGFTDDVGSYQSTEPAVDYNAGFTGALAKMYSLFGGPPLSDTALQTQINGDNPNYTHTCADEYLVEAKINATATNFTEISAYLNNRSGWPARASNTLKFRYYFTLDSANISDITLTTNLLNGATISGPTLYDAANKIYYLTIDFTGTYLYPGGQSPTSRREVQFRLTDSAAWDPTNDFSYNGWNANYAYPNTGYAYAANMPVYDGSAKLCGNDATSNVTPATSTPTNTASATFTAGPSMTPSNTFTPSVTSTATNTPLPTSTFTASPTINPNGTVQVAIKNNGNDNNQQTQFAYQVKNTGTSSLTGLSTRLYFTADNGNAGSAYAIEKYYDQSGTATITGPTQASGNVYYFTINYGTTALAAGGSWEFQTALHLASWGSNFDGTNDWYHTGYAATALPAAYTLTNYIPAYVGTTRIWGVEPGGSGPTSTNTPTGTATGTATSTATGTATSTPSLTQTVCPTLTPASLSIAPVTSPTTATTQMITVGASGLISATVTSEAGTFTSTTPGNGTINVTVTLVANTTNHLTITGVIHWSSTCPDYTTPASSVQIVQNGGGPTSTFTPTFVPPSATPTATPTTPVTTGTLHLQYMNADSAPQDNQMKPHFRIVNTGTTAVSLSGLKLRYYFTRDTAQSLVFNCDYASVGCANLSAAFVAVNPAKPTADYYLEISFSTAAGSIAAGGNTGEIQARINKSDWSNFNETNDYSYISTQTSYADTTTSTLYNAGSLVWGTEP
jgi:hypothetical protein